MEICSNCFKKTPQSNPFCPHCGYPNIEIGLKRCTKGHTIYETYKNCPFCSQMTGNSLINQRTKKNTGEMHTELLNNVTNIKTPAETTPTGNKINQEELTGDKTVMEPNTDDRTKFETMTGYPDKTVMEAEVDKTILDQGIKEPLPSFFAWLVYIDEADKPLQDIRLTRQKSVIGKGTEADIQLKDDFASKLHALIHFDESCFFLTDLGSTNHTWLNGEKINNQELKDGDKIRIGHQHMIFKRVRRNL